MSACDDAASCAGTGKECLCYLELARFLATPAFHHNFGFGVELHAIFALAMENAVKAFFPAAEREIRHRRGDADVNANVSGGSFVAEFSRGGTTGGEQRSLVAVRTAAYEVDRFINVAGVQQA